MNKREAMKVTREVNRIPGLQATGLRHYDGGGYGVEATDTTSGYPITIDTVEAWERRKADWAFRAEEAQIASAEGE